MKNPNQAIYGQLRYKFLSEKHNRLIEASVGCKKTTCPECYKLSTPQSVLCLAEFSYDAFYADRHEPFAVVQYSIDGSVMQFFVDGKSFPLSKRSVKAFRKDVAGKIEALRKSCEWITVTWSFVAQTEKDGVSIIGHGNEQSVRQVYHPYFRIGKTLHAGFKTRLSDPNKKLVYSMIVHEDEEAEFPVRVFVALVGTAENKEHGRQAYKSAGMPAEIYDKKNFYCTTQKYQEAYRDWFVPESEEVGPILVKYQISV